MSDGKLVIETELGTKTFDAQYAELESKLKREQKKLNAYMQVKDIGLNVSQTKVQEIQTNIERLSNKMLDLRLKVRDAGDESKDTENKFSFNFKKMGNTVKKFAYSLIGLRSIYAVVSRASSAYLSQDVELAQKLRSVWVGLGSFLAPVLEMISNSLLKALGYLNVFIKALTGIDFLARANAKALKAQAGAQKELNNQTYDFDVIRKQQDNSSSGGGAGGGDLFDIPELDEKVVAKLQKLAEWLKKNENLIKAVGRALLLVFGASAIAKIVKSIGTLLGMEGLGGLNSVLSTLAQIGIIAIGVSLLYTAMTGRDLIEDLKNIKIGIDELKKSTEQNAEAEKNHTNALREYNDQLIKNIETGELTDEQLQSTTNYLKNQTTAIEEQIKNLESQQFRTKEMVEEEKTLAEQLETNIEVYDALYEQNKLNDDEMLDYMDTIADLIVVKQRLGEDTSKLKQRYEELRIQTGKDKDANYELKDSAQAVEDKYKELTGKSWQVKLNSDTGQAEGGVTKFVRWLNSLIEKPFTFLLNTEDISPSHGGSSGGGHGGSGRAYAFGGIVTQPTRALIGEAGYPEAVLPMTPDYLSTLAREMVRYGNGGGNQPINVYFDGRLIQRQSASREQQRNFITNT